MSQDNAPTSFRPTPEQRRQLTEMVASGWFGTQTQLLGILVERGYGDWCAAGKPHKAQDKEA